MRVTNIDLKAVEKDVRQHIIQHYFSKKTSQGEKMKDVRLNNFELYEIDGTLYSLEEIRAFIKHSEEMSRQNFNLKEENRSLKIDNDFLQRQNAACKLRCSKFAIQVRELESEIADMKFTHKMLNSEEAGRAFARELLGKPMTPEEIAINAAENNYTPYSGDDF